MSNPVQELTRFVRVEAARLGFDLVGVTSADPLEAAQFHARWIAHGYAGDMAWLGRNLDKRADPRQLVPGARSVVCLGMYYDPPPAATGGAVGGVPGRLGDGAAAGGGGRGEVCGGRSGIEAVSAGRAMTLAAATTSIRRPSSNASWPPAPDSAGGGRTRSSSTAVPDPTSFSPN